MVDDNGPSKTERQLDYHLNEIRELQVLQCKEIEELKEKLTKELGYQTTAIHGKLSTIEHTIWVAVLVLIAIAVGVWWQ